MFTNVKPPVIYHITVNDFPEDAIL